MRRYELEDCLEDAQIGKTYEVAAFSSSRGCINACTLIVGFGNPESRQAVWIPEGSQILIEDSKYSIMQGIFSKYGGRREERDLVTSCLKDMGGNIKSLYDYIGKFAKVCEIPSKAPSVFKLDAQDNAKESIKKTLLQRACTFIKKS